VFPGGQIVVPKRYKVLLYLSNNIVSTQASPETIQMDRRKTERRASKKPFVFIERRTGYDRRTDNHTAGQKITFYLRKNDFLLASLLILINTLNLGDLIFTYLALSAGHSEGNPIMKYLFLNYDPVVGGYFKLSIGFLVTVVLWLLRKHRRAIEAILIILAVLTSIFLYHLAVTLSRI
jgi:hypothetical protein